MINPEFGATLAPVPDHWSAPKASGKLTDVCATIADAIRCDAPTDMATEIACMVAHYQGLERMSRGGLRVSSIGKHPLVNALALLGLETGSSPEEKWLTEAGHRYEWWVKAKLVGAQKAGLLPADWAIKTQPDTVYWEGITGNPDLVVIVPQPHNAADNGRPISVTLDCKHVSGVYCRSILKPLVVASEKTGLPNKVQGVYMPELHASALAADERGYIAQSSIYGRCNHGLAAMILFDKAGNNTYVAPIPEVTQDMAIEGAEQRLTGLRNFELWAIGESLENAVAEALEAFPPPALIEQKLKSKATGYYYLPSVFKYAPELVTDLVYSANPHWDGDDLRVKYAPIGAASPAELGSQKAVEWVIAS